MKSPKENVEREKNRESLEGGAEGRGRAPGREQDGVRELGGVSSVLDTVPTKS